MEFAPVPDNLVIDSAGDRSDDRIPLDWVSREKIALGSARALAYLHKPCVKMAHGNIKSSNILLNRDYEPYLSDYGLICLLNPASVGASRFVGYRAVEVTDIRKITMQSDVYSFGVVSIRTENPSHFQMVITLGLHR